MTHEPRTRRIKDLARELSTLLAQEAPRPTVKFLTAADLPAQEPGHALIHPPNRRCGPADSCANHLREFVGRLGGAGT
jgi:hypothetical protein